MSKHIRQWIFHEVFVSSLCFQSCIVENCAFYGTVLENVEFRDCQMRGSRGLLFEGCTAKHLRVSGRGGASVVAPAFLEGREPDAAASPRYDFRDHRGAVNFRGIHPSEILLDPSWAAVLPREHVVAAEPSFHEMARDVPENRWVYVQYNWFDEPVARRLRALAG